MKISEIQGFDEKELRSRNPIKIPIGVSNEKQNAITMTTRSESIDLLRGTPTANEAKYLWLKMATPNVTASESSMDDPKAIPLKME